MGGVGSGWKSDPDTKKTTEDCRSIDVRSWKRHGQMRPGFCFNWQWKRCGEVVASIRVHTESHRVIISYRHRSDCGDWKNERYPICLDWTACNFGSRRPWFLCPAPSCGRRVAILYCDGMFACRRCTQLAYPCQSERVGDRIERKANRIRGRLGWEQGVLNRNGLKPKGMHWKTFYELSMQHDALAQKSLAGMVARLNLPVRF